MIKAIITNETLNRIIEIENNKTILETTNIPVKMSNKFRKNSKKMSSFASNKIEGNPLSYEQANEIIESQNRHLLKPEQEIKNYYNALEYLESKKRQDTKIDLSLILQVQKIIIEGESKDKIGLRGPTPPGVLFAVYDSVTHMPEYIPPEAKDVKGLIEELIDYVNNSNDHPIIKAAIFHYQLVTIHPFEDGNGRTARILSNYILECYGYGFKSVGSLEEYFAYDINEYYQALQMGLPILYYDGRDNPIHPEIWINYFVKVFSLYAKKVVEIAKKASAEESNEGYLLLSKKSRLFLDYLRNNKIKIIIPIEQAKILNVTNKTIINWCVELAKQGFIKPNIVKNRIRSYQVIL